MQQLHITRQGMKKEFCLKRLSIHCNIICLLLQFADGFWPSKPLQLENEVRNRKKEQNILACFNSSSAVGSSLCIAKFCHGYFMPFYAISQLSIAAYCCQTTQNIILLPDTATCKPNYITEQTKHSDSKNEKLLIS